MPFRAEGRQIFFRESKQTHRRAEPLSMFRMGRMLELLLQMDERSGRLDQSLEKLRVLRRDRIVQPNLLQDVVRFVITLLVPALKERAIVRVGRDSRAAGFRRIRFQ